jgi:cytosine/adenosine deaminase-related metal-dependent hydrolase
MLLYNLDITGDEGTRSIRIIDEKIKTVTPEGASLRPLPNELNLSFGKNIAFPGLINSHDHLDFNLFPLLGNRIYNNYAEWGGDIHLKNRDRINAVLNIPQHLRIQWGIYKNLLNGVTTMVHHGKRLPAREDLIDVFQGSDSLHSVMGEQYWKYKLNSPTGRKLVSIHIGEGTDRMASEEIDQLLKWNKLRKKLVGIHGVAMNEEQASKFAALVWCPDSNFFLLGKTAAIERLKFKTAILFGTDSTLSGSWNLWEQLRIARQQHQLTDEELFGALTLTPARIWLLQDRGSITEGQRADLVIARPSTGTSGWNAFYGLNPEDILLVLRKGEIKLFDKEFYSSLEGAGYPVADFYPVSVNNHVKYIYGDLPGLIQEIQTYDPAARFPVAFG